MDWTEGYAARTDYTFGYYRQMNPVFARAALHAAGQDAGPARHACELGFGQGLSVAIHAAAGDCEWWGTDFMPGQAARAQELVEAAGATAHLADESFAEFCTRTDLPQFDFIGLHGIWSWVSPENRRIMLEFFRRRLRPGGTVYVSYNTAAGWASLLPLRQLLLRHTATMSAPGLGEAERIRAALPFLQRVFEACSVYAAQNPLAPAMLRKMQEDGGSYVAHEYLGQHWHLMDVAETADAMGGAKLGYAASARLVDHVPALAAFDEQRALLAEIPDPVFRESVRDVLVGERFRQDLWVKGLRPLSPAARAEAVRALSFVLVEPPEAVEVRPGTPFGTLELPRGAFLPYLEALAGHRPRSVAELERATGTRDLEQTLQAVLVLTHIGAAQPAQEDEAIARARPRAAALNAHFLARARLGGEIAYLANPVTGGATHVPRAQQLFLLAEQDGATDPAAQAAYAARFLGQDDGLQAEAENFASGRRPVLAEMGVA